MRLSSWRCSLAEFNAVPARVGDRASGETALPHSCPCNRAGYTDRREVIACLVIDNARHVDEFPGPDIAKVIPHYRRRRGTSPLGVRQHKTLKPDVFHESPRAASPSRIITRSSFGDYCLDLVGFSPGTAGSRAFHPADHSTSAGLRQRFQDILNIEPRAFGRCNGAPPVCRHMPDFSSTDSIGIRDSTHEVSSTISTSASSSTP